MNRNDIIKKLSTIFCDVFDDNTIAINENTTASDIEAWDSLTHITLISDVEDALNMKFKMKEVVGMKNVGEMADIILSRLS